MTYPLIGNYGRLLDDDQSLRPWLRALVVANATAAVLDGARQLAALLRTNGIPAIAGVDTRALARHLRANGCLRGVVTAPGEVDPAAAVGVARAVARWEDQDFVGQVSPPQVTEYPADIPGGPRIGIVDLGLKANIVRAMRHRGASVRVFPHTAAPSDVLSADVDGVILSPGPGDPARLAAQVALARAVIADGRPLLGICLGHQIVARAAGAETRRLRFGHHGANHPVQDLELGRVQVTAQNHEVQVVGASVTPASGFHVSQVNLNDGSVEGLAPPGAADRDRPVPPGGRARAARRARGVRPVRGRRPGTGRMSAPGPKPASVLILGSGPVVIGQAAEFDYAGTQACRALRAEGIRTILVNSNPATIMTDPSVADAIYLEPLTSRRSRRSSPRNGRTGLLAGLGGQTALNLTAAMADAGVFERHPIRLLGTPLEAIRMAEDREAFRDLLDRIGQPYAPSRIVEGASAEARTASADEALAAIGLPAIIRPAFTLGGTGGGIVETEPGVPRADPGRPPREPDRPGDGRALPHRLAGDRVRGDARRGRHLHRRVRHGERRSARRPHRRFDRGRADPDADRRGPPAAAQRRAGDHPGARRRGRLQRPVRAVAGFDRVRRDRGQPARLAVVGAGVEGDGLSDRPGRRADRGRPPAGRDPERGDRHDRGGVRAGARLRRGQAAALPVRQVSRAPTDARQPDEGDRRGDGDRPDLRLGAQQGAAWARAGGRRAARGGSVVAPDLRLPGRGVRRRPGRRRADPVGRRDRRGMRVHPPRAAERRPDRPAPVPRAIRQPAVAGPRADAPGRPRGA